MKDSRYLKQPIALASVLAIGISTSLTAKAAIALQYTDSGTYAEAGFSPDSGGYINGNDLIGIYHFNVNPVGALPNPFYSVCLSPAGLLDRDWHDYTTISFQQANPGIFPNAWKYGTGPGGTEYWGIQNAAYLWNTYGMSIVNSASSAATKNDQSAALEFAIWSALYNSTGYGHVNTGTGSGVWHPNGLNATIQGYFDSDLAALNGTQGNIPLYTGDILRGVSYNTLGQQQEFFSLGTPIPEPTTMVAGALLLLPFGASTLRILRKKRA
jgi:hypothetical protein